MAPLPFMAMPDMAMELDSSEAAGYVALRARPAASATTLNTATPGARRTNVRAGGSQAVRVAATSGTMAAASRITSGPVLGSVSEPLNTSPTSPWAATHMTRARTAPAARNQPGRRTRRGPIPTTRHSRASTHAVWVPLWANWLPRLVRKRLNQPGSPSAMPTIALCTEEGVRLSGNKKRTAARHQ